MSLVNHGVATFDALIVGSGATGGWAAKKLTESGMQVALVEAGAVTRAVDFKNYEADKIPDSTKHSPSIVTQRPIQATCYALNESNSEWFVNDLENPYTQSKPYNWIRMRILGGRLLGWARHCYRMGDLDFKSASYDDYGEDWPIAYTDLEPYYDEVDRYLGITGNSEGLAHLPDGINSDHSQTNISKTLLRDNVRRQLGYVVTEARLANLARHRRDLSESSCWISTSEGSIERDWFFSPWSALRDAAETGRLTLFPNSVARHVTMREGKANGIGYIDRVTKKFREIQAKVVLLCASTLESTRLLLNSDVGNSSGKLGRHLMDHVAGGGATGIVEFPSRVAPLRPVLHQVYIPRFRNLSPRSSGPFIRGYGLQGVAFADDSSDDGTSAPGSEGGRRRLRVNLMAFGESLSRKENRVDLDSANPDAWGIPTLKISADWCENDLKLWNDSREQAAEILRVSGLEDIKLTGRLSVPGMCIHEIGTARMGHNPKTSVVNSHCQMHDVSNIFVTDGACWVSSGCQNPTLTMMAITSRTCDYIIKVYVKHAL
jgi:choline dehydrogenase-like flavoprotein